MGENIASASRGIYPVLTGKHYGYCDGRGRRWLVETTSEWATRVRHGVAAASLALP